MNLDIHYKVREFIESYPLKVQTKISRAIDLLQCFGLKLTEPNLKKLKNLNLWELRIIFNSNIYRIFIYHKEDTLHLIHGFNKKTQKTPLKEINTALKRAKEIK